MSQFAHPQRAESTADRPTSSDFRTARNRCPECGHRVTAVDVAEAVCRDCDVVVERRPVSTRPPRTLDDEDGGQKRRSGSRVTLLYVDRGIGTSSPDTSIAGGRNAATGGTGGGLRSRGWTNWRTAAEHRLGYALGELRRIGGTLGVPRAEQEEAARLYRRATSLDCVSGRNIDAFTAACLLVAVRRSSARLPVSAVELAPVSRASEAAIRTARRALERELEVGVPPMDPRRFLPRVGTECELPAAVERTARELLNALFADDAARCRGFSPRTLAGAALHLATDVQGYDGLTLDDLEAELGVSSCTISDRKSFVRRHTEEA